MLCVRKLGKEIVFRGYYYYRIVVWGLICILLLTWEIIFSVMSCGVFIWYCRSYLCIKCHYYYCDVHAELIIDVVDDYLFQRHHARAYIMNYWYIELILSSFIPILNWLLSSCWLDVNIRSSFHTYIFIRYWYHEKHRFWKRMRYFINLQHWIVSIRWLRYEFKIWEII